MAPEKLFSVNLWGSHPDENNDDCWTGETFATEADARAAYDNWREYFGVIRCTDTTHVELLKIVQWHEDGAVVWTLDVKRVAKDRKKESDASWRREIAMEAGMLHGVDAYNEAMGYDCSVED